MEKNITAISAATRRNILLGILDNGSTKNATARKAGIPSTTFDRRLAKPETFTLKDLGDIAEALGVQFEDLLKDAA